MSIKTTLTSNETQVAPDKVTSLVGAPFGGPTPLGDKLVELKGLLDMLKQRKEASPRGQKGQWANPIRQTEQAIRALEKLIKTVEPEETHPPMAGLVYIPQ